MATTELVALNTCQELGIDAVAARVLSKRMLPGRSPLDIAAALEAHADALVSKKLVIRRPALVFRTSPLPLPPALARKKTKTPPSPRQASRWRYLQTRVHSHHLGRGLGHPAGYPTGFAYHPGFVCSEASGPIISMAFNGSASLSGISCLVGSCAQQDATYNRPGELLALAFEQDSINCLVLDGHALSGSNNARLRCTVTSVVFGTKWGLFLSGGYDGRVHLWEPEARRFKKLASSPPLGGGLVSPVYSVVVSSLTPTLAFSSNGQITLASFNLDRDDPQDILRVDTPSVVAKKSSRKWANTVDVVRFDPVRPERILGLVGFVEDGMSSIGGRLVQLDAERRGPRTIYQSDRHGITFFDPHPFQPVVAIGSGGVVDDAVGTGSFVTLDLRSPISTLSSTHTGQMDVDTILFSRCGTYLSVTDTIDNSVTIWDTRHRQRALLAYSHHGADQGESMMGLRWLNSGLLVSGGMDGRLKFYTLSQPHAPLQDVLVGHPITCVDASADDSMVFVGTDFGTVHSFSLNSAIASTFVNKYRRTY